ncbi:helix-turn-helix domain-containing protein [Salmonella enterica subsp. enterica serovar Eastbourne]|uniref:Helix-turn-helix domain-containing protein n=1 Tax=Salmonella enterica subsp. enterica serovar Eastbourne TaxID=486993 RepID=A0A702B718_SALET|nr:helix-turn-helix domain-containing protein [Salmonella enterica subsp. enterica serovar Eastbourne]ECA1897623.1 helix-turn-helix domain-containing protein [Salmonella enterica subsp. enterica serovar Eastbourne]HAC6678307.1 helix-turn-helix domain-containing protein [Salmonella enterica subsp. enterica serovar Eastbourne]HAE5115786.1 helix-turn-helix domain-containing protein [Salmonella enterica subsp. enterica serovar Eastbourne]HAE8030269.1 helix-turn-helix domain-containing protein [Salm
MRLKDLPIEVQINFKTNLGGVCVALFGDDPTPALASEPAVNSATTWDIEAGTTNKFTIGDRIFSLRHMREMPQAELAESVGVSPNLVAAWEKHSLEPRAKHVIPLANALECDPMWLLTENATHQDLPDTDNGEHLYRHASQQAGDVSHEAPQR